MVQGTAMKEGENNSSRKKEEILYYCYFSIKTMVAKQSSSRSLGILITLIYFGYVAVQPLVKY